MATAELRAHLRIRAEGLAIITLSDETRIEASVRDISLGGAYLVSGSHSWARPPRSGETVELYLHHLGHAAHAVTVSASVVRVEAGGGGFAVRFVESSEEGMDDPLLDVVVAVAQERGIAPVKLHLKGSRTASARHLLGLVGKLAAVLVPLAGLWLLWSWLDTVL